jgi:hypothetical protein
MERWLQIQPLHLEVLKGDRSSRKICDYHLGRGAFMVAGKRQVAFQNETPPLRSRKCPSALTGPYHIRLLWCVLESLQVVQIMMFAAQRRWEAFIGLGMNTFIPITTMLHHYFFIKNLVKQWVKLLCNKTRLSFYIGFRNLVLSQPQIQADITCRKNNISGAILVQFYWQALLCWLTNFLPDFTSYRFFIHQLFHNTPFLYLRFALPRFLRAPTKVRILLPFL